FQEKREFPYALRFEGTSFAANGTLLLAPTARGLTCATFILAVFKAIGLDMVNEQSWPVRDDEDRRFLEAIRSQATPEHVAILEREIEDGVRRIRPDEVAGAAMIEWPAEFGPTRAQADIVVERLDDAELERGLSER
ncbi:MAG: hypothetical protein KC457_23840, partial [Myxococcales bacterium]|nr:hypothetical protein [Myxococcales bacterium]